MLTPFFPETRSIIDPFTDLDVFQGAMMPRGRRNLLGPDSQLMRQTRNSMRQFAPILKADIVESENDFHVNCDLPGVHKDDLDVSIENGCLSIKAERKATHEEDSAFTHSIERSFGRVSRMLEIPSNADPDSANAKFENGVLCVTFTKRGGEAAGRKLAVN